jgi:hypothetical protein
MTADEIRNECKNNLTKFSGDGKDLLTLMRYGAQMEIAAQLAELNTHLDGLVTRNETEGSVLVAKD